MMDTRYKIKSEIQTARHALSAAVFFAFTFLQYFAADAATEPPGATEVQRIIAVVNDDMISAYDVTERIGLFLATTGQVQNDAELDAMRESVIELLIDELLQIQEAKELEVKITAKDIDDSYAQLAARNNVSVQQFDASLEDIGASKITVLQQLRAAFAWDEVMNQRLRPFLAISGAEVNNYLDNLIANKGKPEYRLAEIFLVVKRPEREAEVRRSAERLVTQIRGGADFNEIARQFSDTASGAVGGDMGWLVADQIDAVMRAPILALKRGEVTDPIRSAGGYYIFQISEQRKVLSAGGNEARLDLQQIIVSIKENDPAELANRLNVRTSQITRCSDIPAIAREVGAWDYGPLGEVRLGDLPDVLKMIVGELQPVQAGYPIQMGSDLRILVVCGRTEPEISEPSFDEIEDFLSNQRLSIMARRYMRDLRGDAIIDRR